MIYDEVKEIYSSSSLRHCLILTYLKFCLNPVACTYWKNGVPGGSLFGVRKVASKLQLRRGGI